MQSVNDLMEKLQLLAITYGMKLIYATITLVVGLWFIGFIVNRAERIMKKRHVDPSLAPFLKSLLGIGLKAALVVSVIGMIGIEMTSFVAILGAAGLAIGLALQGTLQNFAGGVMILLFKPFKVGDFIEAQGFSGMVNEIQIFNTLLTTGDNKVIIIPNGGLANGTMTNFSTMSTRRVDLSFNVSYESDFEKALALIRELVIRDRRTLKDPEPFVRVMQLSEYAVNIVARIWVKSDDYWPVYHDLTEAVKKTFDANEIRIPYPTRDIHMAKTF